MNILSRDQQITAISALTEGCSIRATERLTGIHRDTIMRLGVRLGDGCAGLHDRFVAMRDAGLLASPDQPARMIADLVTGDTTGQIAGASNPAMISGNQRR